MRNLTENQKEFLLENFFKNEEFAGWKTIATDLLERGNCVVAGKNCIWVGGIGNFIKTKDAENAFDCTLYEFDLEHFLSSEWYKEIRNEHILILSEKKREIERDYEDVCQLAVSDYSSRDIYQELRKIGLTHDQCSDVMDLVDSLPIHIKQGIENTKVSISNGIVTVEPNNHEE